MSPDIAIKGIMEWRDKIHRQDMWENPSALSDAMTRLAVYNSYLADEISVAHKKVTDKAYAVFTEAATTEPVTKAEQMSRGESTTEREYFEKLKNINRATSDLISVLQTRIRVAENALKQEG